MNPRVLVVDDELQILRGLRVVLRSAGYDVATAQTKAEALDAVSVRPPDAMLLDLVAGTAEVRLQRPQDLRLVVDDEDPAAHVCTGARSAGIASTKLAPEPGRGSAHSRQPLAAANPCAIASPRPVP